MRLTHLVPLSVSICQNGSNRNIWSYTLVVNGHPAVARLALDNELIYSLLCSLSHMTVAGIFADQNSDCIKREEDCLAGTTLKSTGPHGRTECVDGTCLKNYIFM